MKAPNTKLYLLILSGVLSSYFLHPGKEELALIYLNSGLLTEAEASFEAMYQENPNNRAILMPLSKVYMGKGAVDESVRIFETYSKNNMEDLDALTQLAKLYRDTNRYYAYMRVQEKLNEFDFSMIRQLELTDLYLLFGMKEEAIESLKLIVKTEPSNPALFRQLIDLQASKGDYRGADETLLAYFNAGNPITSYYSELRLRLLLSAERTIEAMTWAKECLENNEHDDALRLIALLYSGGVAGGISEALNGPAEISPNTMPVWLIEILANQSWLEGRTDLLETLVSQLDPERQGGHPVVMAKIALTNGERTALSYWLKKSEQLNEPTSWQLIGLARIYLEVGYIKKAIGLLYELADDSALSGDFAKEAAIKIVKSGEVKDGLQLFKKVKLSSANTAYGYSWAMLASADGSPEVAKWLNGVQGKTLASNELKDLYYLAVDHLKDDLAIEIARIYFDRHKSATTAELLATSLIKVGKEQQAADILQPFVALDEKLSRLYRHVLTTAWKEKGLLRSRLVSYLTTHLQIPGLTQKEREQVSFQLLEMGEKEAAIREFKALAEGQGPEGKYVKQLLFIWGPLPEDDGLDWLQRRAMSAPAVELAGWWRHLVNTGASQRVIDLASKRYNQIPPEAESLLITALKGNTPAGVKRYLLDQSEAATDAIRLQQLATHAKQENLIETSEYILKKLLAISPKNAIANRDLGIAAFRRGEKEQAKTLLRSYLDVSAGDWEAIFYLAEMEYQDGNKATGLYQDCLSKIKLERESSKQVRHVLATVYQRLGRGNQALDVFDSLVADFPNDSGLKADYSTMLIEMGQLEKAAIILGEEI